MTSPRQLVSNAKNAVRSTGPRSKGGKAHSSQNATRHGLFGRKAPDIRDIERLAAALSGADAECSRDAARATATSQLELIHIRKVRAAATRQVTAVIVPPDTGSNSAVTGPKQR